MTDAPVYVDPRFPLPERQHTSQGFEKLSAAKSVKPARSNEHSNADDEDKSEGSS